MVICSHLLYIEEKGCSTTTTTSSERKEDWSETEGTYINDPSCTVQHKFLLLEPQNPSKFYPTKIFMLANLLCKAANPPMFFAAIMLLGNNPSKFSTAKFVLSGSLLYYVIRYVAMLIITKILKGSYTCS